MIDGHARNQASILVVCTGNICRSPAGERLLAAALGPLVLVTSAGTAALTGHPIAEPMRRRIHAAGGDADSFRAQRVTERLVREADLVLTMTREHRADVVQLWPGAVRRSFTVLEYARLLGALDGADPYERSTPGRLRAATRLAAAHRRPIATPADDDISDPFRRSEAHYDAVFGQIRDAVTEIAGRVS